MSRKTVSIALPAKAARAEASALPETEEWVRERDPGADQPWPAQDPTAFARRPMLIDLRAERSLAEVLALSAVVPFALGWLWIARAMTGRMRF